MRKTQRPDFTRAVQWLSKHMTTLTQACLVLCLALISVAYIRIFNPTASESAFSPASRPSITTSPIAFSSSRIISPTAGAVMRPA